MNLGSYRGVFPVMPTIFDERGALNLDGQLRCPDFMIDAGSDGLCILANFSEQFAVTDDERDLLTVRILEHVRGRVPVIVTTTHFSASACRPQPPGAAMVMVMPRAATRSRGRGTGRRRSHCSPISTPARPAR